MGRMKIAPGVAYTSATMVLLGVSIVIAASLATPPESKSVQSNHHSPPTSQKFLASLAPSSTHVLGAQTTEPLSCRQMPCLALTFDDGPNAQTTPQVLAALEARHIPASFFVIGNRVDGNQALLARMYHDGDEVESHSWSHPNLTTLPPVQIKEQFDFSSLAIQSAGLPPPTLIRPPYGAVNKTVIDSLPVPLAMWDEDPKDWRQTTPAQVVQKVEAAAKPGGVVDMHDVYQSTASALPQIITDLSARGFHFVTFSQLNQPTPGSHQEYFGLKP